MVKTMKRALLMLTLLASPMLLSAQSIKGVVKDDGGEPVIGATVREVGTQNGAVTDFEGNFELKNVMKDEISVSYVGFLTQTVNVKGKRYTAARPETAGRGGGGRLWHHEKERRNRSREQSQHRSFREECQHEPRTVIAGHSTGT